MIGAACGRDYGASRLVAAVDAAAAAFAAGLSPRLGAAAGALAPAGKRARARFAALLGRAEGAPAAETRRIALAAELTHQASLLQDDCVDDASRRRGRPSANRRFGAKAGLLLGDLAVLRALEESEGLGPDTRRSHRLCVREMALGELREELERGRWRAGAERYRSIARQKTGALFAWIGEAAARAAGRPGDAPALRELGYEAGLAFQIVDDVLDYREDQGKDRLQDLRTGRVNHPLLLALLDPELGPEARRRTDSLFAGFREEEAERLAAWLQTNGLLERSRREAERTTSEACARVERLPRAGPRRALAECLWKLARRC